MRLGLLVALLLLWLRQPLLLLLLLLPLLLILLLPLLLLLLLLLLLVYKISRATSERLTRPLRKRVFTCTQKVLIQAGG